MGRFLGICAFLLLLSTSHSFAYTIPNHSKITERVVEEFNFCARAMDVAHLEISSNAAKALKKGNASEDRHFLRKWFSQHYYNPDKDLGGGKFGCGSASLKSRFLKLEREIAKTRSPTAFGKLLHYLQDVTVPAHVIPVPHAFGDSFDGYEFEFPELISKASCLNIFSEDSLQKSYFEILHMATQETLGRSLESFSYEDRGEMKEISWQHAFWNPSPTTKGFGDYGLFGDRFGETSFKKYKIDAAVYKQFSTRQIRSAIDASLIALYKYQMLLK